MHPHRARFGLGSEQSSDSPVRAIVSSACTQARSERVLHETLVLLNGGADNSGLQRVVRGRMSPCTVASVREV